MSEVGDAFLAMMAKEPVLRNSFVALLEKRIEELKTKAVSSLLGRDDYVKAVSGVGELRRLRVLVIGEEEENGRRAEYGRRIGTVE